MLRITCFQFLIHRSEQILAMFKGTIDFKYESFATARTDQIRQTQYVQYVQLYIYIHTAVLYRGDIRIGRLAIFAYQTKEEKSEPLKCCSPQSYRKQIQRFEMGLATTTRTIFSRPHLTRLQTKSGNQNEKFFH